ncbi:beta-1,3-galactosyltransferase 5-like [Myripristis murdjan]|uniref:Hexosyltransferase n=1 Tax=Myripristis murdjan TaxID=586833 RepID=A0A667ZQS2_9TELE|nr:beta-1,3-galactosyltransferase 5-like [Myripristis murdjan]
MLSAVRLHTSLRVFTSCTTPAHRGLMGKWKTHLSHIFICILITMAVFLICFSSNWNWAWWNTLDHNAGPKEHNRSSPGQQAPRTPWKDSWLYYVAYPGDYKFVMDDTDVCKVEAPFLVLMVPVAPADVAARDAIRKTWGNETLVQGKLVQTLFLLGVPGGADAQQQQQNLKQENLLHHDLIQSNFQDSYRNLTIKTMVMLEWLTAHCLSASYVMKIDSDMLLNVQNLVNLLLDPNTPKQNYMTGLVWWHSPVLRNPEDKFYMPKEVFDKPEYPPYPLGMSYVMSRDLPGKILGVSPQIKPIFIEDAYLGMCLKHLGISPTDPPEKSMFIVNPKHSLNRCSLSKVIAVTTENIPQMMSYWEMIREPGAAC